MTIKTWYQRLEAMDDGHITTHEDVRNAQQAEIDELRAALKAKPAFVQARAQARAQLEKEWCELNAMKAALKAQPVQPVKQADHSELVRELRYVADWAQHHLDKAQIINAAADALEGAKP